MRMNNILGLFPQSPFKPLQQLSLKVNETCNLLSPLLEASFSQNWEECEKLYSQIIHYEFKADIIKREIRLKLPRGLFMPIDRRDLLELTTQLDKLANLAKQIASMIASRHLYLPNSLQEDFKTLLQHSLDATQQVNKVIGSMDNLLESGFKGRELGFAQDMITALDKIEDGSEKIEISLNKKLFSIEKEIHPVDAIFLYKTIDKLAILSEQAQRIGSRVELMLSRS